jgi:aryl-alcohol dehydrogenase-like predicted oxidoreductase
MKRKLGRSNIEVSAMGMGCWAIGGPFWSDGAPVGWGEVDDKESIRAIHTCLDFGVNFFDTANVYGAGHSERVLGKALMNRRGEVVIATKFGTLFDEETRDITGSSAAPEDILKACDNSLRRLNTDYIDLYQFHINEYPVVNAGEVRDTLQELVKVGKIRTFGWSTDSPERAEFFGQSKECSAIQLQLNVLEDNPEMVHLCERLDLTAINRGPLAMGLLTGKYKPDSILPADDIRGSNPVWLKYFKDGRPSPVWFNKVEALREILTSSGRTMVQGTLAWLWARSEKTIPIPGIRNIKQATENCRAMEFGPLNDYQMAEIEELLGR